MGLRAPQRPPRIAVKLDRPVPFEALAELHRFSGESLSALRRRVQEGKPVLEVDMFSNDAEAIIDPRVHFDRIRDLLELTDQLGCAVTYYGLEADETFDDVDMQRAELTPAMIRSRLQREEERDGADPENPKVPG